MSTPSHLCILLNPNLYVLTHIQLILSPLSKITILLQLLSFLVFFNDTINHQASFIKKALFEKYGLYREDLKIVSDWEFFMKTILFENCTHKYIDILIVSYEGGGISSDVILFNEERNGILKNFFPILHADFDHISRLVKYENSRLFKPVITFYEYKFIKKILFLFKSSLSSHK